MFFCCLLIINASFNDRIPINQCRLRAVIVRRQVPRHKAKAENKIVLSELLLNLQ